MLIYILIAYVVMWLLVPTIVIIKDCDNGYEFDSSTAIPLYLLAIFFWWLMLVWFIRDYKEYTNY